MQYSAVLFDMDGVIVDTEQSVSAFWQRVADQYSITLSHDDFTRHVYGRPADRTFDALFPNMSADDRQAVHAAMQQHETQDTYHALPGVVSFLWTLQRHGIPTALVTSGGPWKVGAVLDQLGIDGLFAARVTTADISVGKPDPQCYLLAAEILGVPPAECLVFEDAVSGVEAAVAAGSTCVGIARRGRENLLRAARARYFTPDFSMLDYHSGVLDLRNGTTLRLRGS